MIRLSKSQVLLLHEQLVAETGGSPGLRDEGMLDSALNAPFQTFGGEDVYPSLQQKAAHLCFGLVKNHPFVDGNKRIGAHVMLVFLALNVILSRLVDTFISRISLTMLPVPNPHNTVCVLSWEEARHWQSRSSGYSSS